MSNLRTSIRGHDANTRILARYPFGTYDVEVIDCPSMPDMVGECYRVTGLWDESISPPPDSCA